MASVSEETPSVPEEKSIVFMCGGTQKELEGIRGYPRRFRFKALSHEETVDFMRKTMLSDEMPEEAVEDAKELLFSILNAPDACLDVMVSDTDSDAEEITYEPTESDLAREKQARENARKLMECARKERDAKHEESKVKK